MQLIRAAAPAAEIRAMRRTSADKTPASSWRAVFTLLAILSLTFLTACNDLSALPFAEEPTPTPSLDAQPPASSATAAPVEDSPDSRQLVVWLPEFGGYGDEGGAGDVLDSAIRQFEQQHSGVNVEVQEKAESGPADMMSYLRLAQRVAPAILPDVLLLDSQQLWELADLGLLLPLETSPMQRSPDFYQFALDSAAYNGAWYGVPYAADVLHLASFLETEQTAPNTWNDLLTADEPYLYAAGGPDAYHNGSVLLQYVGAGGQLLENGSTSNEEALGAVFEFTKTAEESGVIPEAVSELSTLDGVWNALAEQGWGSGNVSAARYLIDREAAPGLGYAQIPTRNGLPATLGTTWSLVVLSEDEEQRALASALIGVLLDPGVQGAWSQYVHRLPTQRSALQDWSIPSAYTDFLNRQLEVAVALPNGRVFADFTQRVLQAQLAVLRGELSPQEAVESVRGPS